MDRQAMIDLEGEPESLLSLFHQMSPCLLFKPDANNRWRTGFSRNGYLFRRELGHFPPDSTMLAYAAELGGFLGVTRWAQLGPGSLAVTCCQLF